MIPDSLWFSSAQAGDIKMIKYLTSAFRSRDANGRTALMLYVGNGHSEDLAFFSAEIGMVDNQGMPALKYAVDAANAAAIPLLAREFSINIPYGRSRITCEAYLRSKLGGYTPGREKRRDSHIKHEVSLMSASALELTQRGNGDATQATARGKGSIKWPEGVAVNRAFDLEAVDPRLSFYTTLARHPEGLSSFIHQSLPFINALERFIATDLERILALRREYGPKLSTEHAQPFKQRYLPLYDKYREIAEKLPPHLHSSLIASLKPSVATNYRLFMAIFENKTTVRSDSESLLHSVLSESKLAASSGQGARSQLTTPLVQATHVSLDFDTPPITPPFTYNVTADDVDVQIGTNVQQQLPYTITNPSPSYPTLVQTIVEKITPEVNNQLLKELLNCLTRVYTRDLSFVRDDLMFTQYLAKMRQSASTELAMCQQKLNFYRNLYSKLTTLYTSIASHPVLPLFILNCNLINALAPNLACPEPSKCFVHDITTAVSTLFRSSGVHLSEKDAYDEPLADPLYRLKMDCIASHIKEEEKDISHIIDSLIGLEALISEQSHMKALQERLEESDTARIGEADHQLLQSVRERCQELRSSISSFWPSRLFVKK